MQFKISLIAAAICLISVQADVLISEIMFHPAHDELTPEPVGEEFIELTNTDLTNAVFVGGWQIDRGVSLVFPDAVIGPGEQIVLAADPAIANAKYGNLGRVIGPWIGRLSNSGERIRLVDESGAVIDEVSYADQGDWAVRRRGPEDSGHRGWVWEHGADGQGSSLELLENELPNDYGQNWQVGPVFGSPGKPNISTDPDPAPLILDVSHSPAIPSPETPVIVTARLLGVQGAQVEATVSYGTDSNSVDNRSLVTMKDDGLSGDGAPNDQVFGARLPAFPEGTVVDFYVVALDRGAQRTWPGPTDQDGGQRANALFQVEGSDPTNGSDLPIYRLVLSDNENEEFDFSNFNRRSNAQMNATFISQSGDETEIRYQAGLRRRGAGSRSRSPRTLRINLPRDRSWQGTTRMNLNAQYNYLQLVGQKIFASAGLPSAQARAVELVINGEEEATNNPRLYGAYVHLEPQSGDSVERQFPDDDGGNLYSKRRPDEKLAYRSGDIAAYLEDGWSKSTNNSAADWSDLDAWLRAVQDTSNPDYLENLEAVMDLEQWMRWFGVMTLLANGETNISNGADDDYYVYGGEFDRRIKAVPHDLDTILGIGDGSAITNPNHTIYDMVERGDVIPAFIPLMRHPKVVPLYHCALLDLIDGPFSKSRFDELVSNCLRDRVPATVLQGMLEFMDARREYVRSVVDPPLTAEAGLEQVSGYYLAGDPHPILRGSFNLAEVAQVSVNGKSAFLDHGTGTWSTADPDASSDFFISSGETWRILDNGSDQGTAWRQSNFNDDSWRTGEGEFGYGDDDESTVIRYGRFPFNFLNDANNKYVTTYFRKSFTIQDPNPYQDFVIRMKRDDGAAVYVNGELVVLDNLQENPGYQTFADSLQESPNEDTFFEYIIASNFFLAGDNTIAVEVHQGDRENSDLSFDLELFGRQLIDDPIVNLVPGINQMIVEAKDSEGAVIESTVVPVWFRTEKRFSLGGRLTGETILRAEDGPYLIESDVTVPPGSTIEIEPGATLYFEQGTALVVQGKMDAVGEPYRRIQFTVEPGSGTTWQGLLFQDSREENRVAHVDQSFSSDGNQSMEILRSRVLLENVIWSGTTKTILEVRNPQLRVVNCNFPPTSGNEVIHGSGLVRDEYFDLDGNVFQTSSGYNDIVDFSGGRRPGPIIYVVNNLFEGGTDDALDFDGIDAHVEGNIFRNIKTDDPGRSSISSAIATDGDAHLTVVRNVFENVDHALLLKNESDAIFENNYVSGAALGVFSFREPLRPDVDAGSDLIARGNILVNNALTFRFPDHPREDGGSANISADFNMMPEADHTYGSGNLDFVPHFENALSGDYRLVQGSPGKGAGVNGSDVGPGVPRGVVISGEPASMTDSRDAQLQVYMPGISGIESGSFEAEYRWSLDGGALSQPVSVSQPIALDNLALGEHQVSVIGKDSAGRWQEVPALSRSWTVVSELAPVVRLNEIFVIPEAGDGWVELFNSGSSAVDLTGVILSRARNGNNGVQFGAGTSIPAGGFLRQSLTGDLKPDGSGDSFYLIGGFGLLDTISFGSQIPGFSIGRSGFGNSWSLAVPSPDATNSQMGVGDRSHLKINEWASRTEVLLCDDFVEIYNPLMAPVDLGGLFLSDNPGGNLEQFAIPPLTFVSGKGFLEFDFSLQAESRNVVLSAEEGRVIDLVAYTAHVEDVSYARTPDGGETIQWSQIPTPGMTNGKAQGGATTTVTELIQFQNVWRFDDRGQDLGTGWRETDFDDNNWKTGEGLIGFESSDLPDPGLNTVLVDPDDNASYIVTYYFRTTFDFNGDPENSELALRTIIDDGAVFYLNGQILHNEGIDSDPAHGDFADRSVGNGGLAGPFILPVGSLRKGENVLAGEVHQVSDSSSDIVFGAELVATETIKSQQEDPELARATNLLDHLRITELMFSPPGGSNEEFIELKNVGSEPLQLEGVAFTDGISFTFPEWVLEPGDYVLVVKNEASFVQKYGGGLPVAGQYSGRLSNEGEEVVLKLPDPYSVNIQKFDYEESWFPLALQGSSIEIRDPDKAVREWSQRDTWRAGPTNGSPGSVFSVLAGEMQIVSLSDDVSLRGEVTGDWNPALTWSLLEGPATVTFGDKNSANSSVNFTLPGTYRFLLSAGGEGGNLASETTIAVNDRYQLWAARNQVVGDPVDDPDQDGLTNLFEYALSANPNEPSPKVLQKFRSAPLRFSRNLRKPDVIYRVETSPELSVWTEASPRVESSTADLENYRVVLPNGRAWFARLVVILTE